MTKKPLIVMVLAVLSMVLWTGWAAAEKEPVVGYVAGNVQFSATLTPEDAAYLGVPAGAPFTLKDIKAPYVLVESFNTACPHCMHQAPVLNQLFQMVQSDAKLKEKVKFISAGQGNDETGAQMWKAVQKVPFPVVPDKESKLGKALDFTPYPVSVLLDKSGKVLWVHIGTFDNAAEALKEIKKVVK